MSLRSLMSLIKSALIITNTIYIFMSHKLIKLTKPIKPIKLIKLTKLIKHIKLIKPIKPPPPLWLQLTR